MSSSAFNTAVTPMAAIRPTHISPAQSPPMNRKIPDAPPPTFVTTPISGLRKSSASARNSSGVRHAHLNHGYVVLRLQLQQHQRQNQIDYKIPSDFSTRNRVLSTCAIASFVVVFPADPVTATSGLPHNFRHRRRQSLKRDQRVFGPPVIESRPDSAPTDR